MKRTALLSFIFGAILLLVSAANYMSFTSYKQMELLSVVPLNSVLFLLIGAVLLGISCFTAMQLYDYITGKLFMFYTLLLGLSISLAPCARLNEAAINMIRMVCTFFSGILFFQIIGYLTVSTKSIVFRILRAVLITVVICGFGVQMFLPFPLDSLDYGWVYAIASESMNGCVLLAAVFSLIVMLANYKKGNEFAAGQTRALLSGIGIGVLLFMAASAAPYFEIVKPRDGGLNAKYIIEIEIAETVIPAIPLLLLSGVSIAIIFMLLRREFTLKDARLKLIWFIMFPLYFSIPNVLLIAFSNAHLWLLLVINLTILLPLLMMWREKLNPVRKDTEEQTYQWRLMEDVEKEKQELSSYLHDEVLQSLIAFSRLIKADDTGRYDGMKTPLSNIISQIRSVSHNLYPTMVEDLGLEQSLQIFFNELQERYQDVKISYQYEFHGGILPKPLALAFYRIAKELAVNAAKHADAMEIACSLREDDSGYYVRVKDNGKGFPLPNNDDLLRSPHMGLYTVKKQTLNLRGQVSFQSDRQTGTDYHIYFPKGAA